jgi:hypothetical protein
MTDAGPDAEGSVKQQVAHMSKHGTGEVVDWTAANGRVTATLWLAEDETTCVVWEHPESGAPREIVQLPKDHTQAWESYVDK